MEELKPCPFCENNVIEHHTWVGFHYGDSGYSPKVEEISCIVCKLNLKVRGDDIIKEEAFERWNTRATAPDTVTIKRSEVEAIIYTFSLVTPPRERLSGVLWSYGCYTGKKLTKKTSEACEKALKILESALGKGE